MCLQKNGLIDKLLQDFKIKTSKRVRSPTSNDCGSHADCDGASFTDEERTRSRSTVCSLMYIALKSRADLCVAISVLGTRGENAQRVYTTPAKRTLQYLDGTKEWQLALKLGAGEQLVIFADSNCGPKDHKKRRCRTGIMITFETAPIFGISKIQKSVALRSSEAGLNALGEAATTTIQLRRVLDEPDVLQMTTAIAQDNVGATEWVEAGAKRQVTKREHIELKMNYVMQGIDSKDIKLEKIST